MDFLLVVLAAPTIRAVMRSQRQNQQQTARLGRRARRRTEGGKIVHAAAQAARSATMENAENQGDDLASIVVPCSRRCHTGINRTESRSIARPGVTKT